MARDYDGDGKTDVAVFRPSNGYWYILNSGNNSVNSIPFGVNGDRLTQGDYDGDGKADVAVQRPDALGTWYIVKSTTLTHEVVNFSAGFPVPTGYLTPLY